MDSQRNKIAYITGCSRGIGQAIAELLLDRGYIVYGISRTSTIQHHHYYPIQLDLSKMEAVEAFYFDAVGDEILLINNAGAIGEIAPVGSLSNKTIVEVMNINTLAPQVLMNKFLATYKNQKLSKAHIINISSGAGKYAIDAWATYCASKAAIDLFSETIRQELQLHQLSNWFIHSIAPGVVDTAMQGEIRAADPSNFKAHDRFIQLKAENELAQPEIVARKILPIIQNPQSFENTLLSVRDL